MNILKDSLSTLTWDDLRQLAGTKILNRGKLYKKRVYDLSAMKDNGLIARVQAVRTMPLTLNFKKMENVIGTAPVPLTGEDYAST